MLINTALVTMLVAVGYLIGCAVFFTVIAIGIRAVMQTCMMWVHGVTSSILTIKRGA